MFYSFDFNQRVEYIETDKMGVVHNCTYFWFFEKGRTETMRHLGIAYKEMEDRGVMMPLVEQYCKYISPSYYDDIITIRTVIEELPTSRFCFKYIIFRKEEDGKETLIAQGNNVLAFIDINTRRPMRCPKWVSELLQEKLEVRN
ncbi:MAG: thioesterase family protein [Bacteroidales bacterium]|jgi:acyl-CoA thioester hydrolase